MRGLVGLLLISVFLVQCKNEDQKDNKEDYLDPNVFFCDAEQLSKDGTKFVSYGNEFNGGVGRTKEEAYEGEYSCLVDKNNMYGLTYIFRDLKPGECFEVTVHRKTADHKGILVAQSVKPGVYKYEQFSFRKKDANGWDILAMKFQAPMNVDSLQGLKIYVYNADDKGQKVYFDNLKIRRYQRTPFQEPIKDDVFNIQLADEDWKKLKAYRDQAVKDKVISKKLKKEFKGILKYQGKTVKIKLRLKGDWTDHLEGDKWSYRIKIEDGQTIMGLKSFSIQNPTIRDFLQEWVIHEVCKKEDLLTTKYEYVPVAINGIDFGLYNLEEHFEKQLVESKNRREGVILKFGEEGFWEGNLYFIQNNQYTKKPFYESSTILPFKKKKTFKTPKLEQQFYIAQNLMQRYKDGDDDIENYMDIERLAKAYALMDVGNSEHAFAWHNQRFYYNPVLSKLELITYDCYSKPGESLKRAFPIKGNAAPTINVTMPHEYCLKSAFDNPEFQKLYFKYLKEYSSEEYLTGIINDLKPKIDSLTQMIKQEYKYYFYDENFLAGNGKKIRETLPEYEKKISDNSIKFVLQEGLKNLCIPEKPFKYISLNAHIEKTRANGAVELSMLNYHCRKIRVIGYSIKSAPDSIISLPTPVTLVNYPENKKETSLVIKEVPRKLYYKVLEANDDSIYSVKPVKWIRPRKENSPHQEVALELNSTIGVVDGNNVQFKKGVHKVEKSIIIPKGYVVNFEPGTELIFNKGTFFMSYSPVKMIGTKKDRIKISSEDATGNGFTVLQAKGKSRLEFVVFDGLNTYNKNGWTLTGAVTFYESEVEIENTIFTNNHCEDGLNIIQSKFVFESNLVSNTFADGFDADFCEGTITNSKFHDIGNDCLDFSGSTISVLNCEIKGAGDKGISCGEQSNVTISKTSISNALIGIASKDNTEAIIESVSLSNCGAGFSVFQKKPEYGPATIIVKSHNLSNVTTPQFIEEGSQIIMKN